MAKMKKNQRSNNDLQNTTQKTKDRATVSHSGMVTAFAQLVRPIALLLTYTNII
jgi:hypothetical protein